MAGSVNLVVLVGTLGRDPESRSFQSGDRIVSLSVATSDSWKDKTTGERKTKTEWHNVVIHNEALCGAAEQYLRKGSLVYINGRLQTRKWTTNDGVEKYMTEVVIPRFGGNMTILGGFGDRQESFSGRSGSPKQTAGGPEFDDEIPF